MSNVEVIGGQLDFQIGNTPFEAMYYTLDGNGSNWSQTQWATMGAWGYMDSEPLYDTLWAIRMTQPVADGVDVNLTYATQLASSGGESHLPDVQLIVAGVVVPF